ncbi:hypothetical protein YC2023_019627 [Brassica napus]
MTKEKLDGNVDKRTWIFGSFQRICLFWKGTIQGKNVSIGDIYINRSSMHMLVVLRRCNTVIYNVIIGTIVPLYFHLLQNNEYFSLVSFLISVHVLLTLVQLGCVNSWHEALAYKSLSHVFGVTAIYLLFCLISWVRMHTYYIVDLEGEFCRVLHTCIKKKSIRRKHDFNVILAQKQNTLDLKVLVQLDSKDFLLLTLLNLRTIDFKHVNPGKREDFFAEKTNKKSTQRLLNNTLKTGVTRTSLIHDNQ